MIATYTVQQIKLAAYNQTDPPGPLNMAEQILYLTLCDVYRRFRDGQLSPSEGERLFRDAAQRFEQNSAMQFLSDRIVQNHSELWKRIESAAAAYVMSGHRTPEADAFVEAVYDCKLKNGGDTDSNT